MIFILFCLSLILCLGYIRVKPRTSVIGPFLPDAYIAGLAIYALGATYLVIFAYHEGAAEVAIMGLVGLNAGLIGGIATSLTFVGKYGALDWRALLSKTRYTGTERRLVALLAFLCVLVMLVSLFWLLTSRSILVLFELAVKGDSSSFLAARKLITSGEEDYFAPGYVKQFRDILAPILLVAVSSKARIYGWKHSERLRYQLLIGLTVFSMFLTGQRLLLVLLALLFGVDRYYSAKKVVGNHQKKKTGVLILVSLGLCGYVLLSQLLGRVESGTPALGTIGNVFVGLFERIFLAAPRENGFTWYFWSAQSPTYGESWVLELLKVLPGAGGLGLSNELHYLTGGSEQGNSPLGLAPDTWYAWGWGGVILLCALYPLALAFLDLWLFRTRSFVAVGCRYFLFVSLPIIYSPYGFILYGGFACVLLLAGIKLFKLVNTLSQKGNF